MTHSSSWSALEAVKQRISHRTYDGLPLPPDVRETLEKALREPPLAPFGSRVRLALVEKSSAGQPVRLGTYGIIRGATTFLVGAIQRVEHAEEDFGFVFEWAILRATSLGLGTCWLGGTLRRGEFATALGLRPGEFIPAATPVGYAAGRRSIMDAMTRWGAGSKHRKPWSELFFAGSFQAPLSETDSGAYATVLEMVRLAPSASNRQPWRIVMDRERRAFHLFLQRTAGYGYPGVDLQRIDMGIAMCHFELSVRELGIEGGWTQKDVDVKPLPARTSYLASWTMGA
ncbi:nitroreductase family protein [Candidatus Fermentibacteria bacterium]|nr:nitroreductase family protein [Candidatus Fermentibacteria bacterium]